MRLVLKFVALMFLASTAVAENGTVHDCDFKVARGKWLSEKVIFGVGEKSGDVRVYDGIIHHAEGKPIFAKVSRNDEKRFVIHWRVSMPDKFGRTADIKFRLTYFRKNGKASIVSDVQGYDNFDSASGRCKLSKGKV